MKILIVDDETMVTGILARLLEDHQVTAKTDANEALEEISSKDFDIVFCDLSMPGMSGDTLYRLAEERRPGSGSKFVFMTGGVFTSERQAFLEGLPNQVLQKPFNAAQLEALVEAVKQGSTDDGRQETLDGV